MPSKMRLEFSWFSPEKEDWETWNHPASQWWWLHSWERKSWAVLVPRKEAGDRSWVDLVQKVFRAVKFSVTQLVYWCALG